MILEKIRRLRRIVDWLGGLERHADQLDIPVRSSYKHTKVLVGAMLAQLNNQKKPGELRDVEFQVFSQFGDDGIIQFLVHSLELTNRTFIEFGVEDYTESNTRFLLVKDKWTGVVYDGDKNHINYINGQVSALPEHFFDVDVTKSQR